MIAKARQETFRNKIIFRINLPGVARFSISTALRPTDRRDQQKADQLEATVNAHLTLNEYDALLALFPQCERLRELPMFKKGGEGLTINDLLDKVQEDYDLNSRKNRGKFQYAANPVRAFMGERLAKDVDEALIHDFVRHQMRPDQERVPKIATVNRQLSALSRCFSLAKEKHWISWEPPAMPHYNEAGNARKGFFEPEDLAAFLRYLPDHTHNIVKTLYLTGWRKSEVLSRKRSHVNLDDCLPGSRYRGWLRLDPGETKTDKPRLFPLIPELRAVIEDQLRRTREFEIATGRIVPWLFHRNGERLLEFRKSWNRAARLVEAERVRQGLPPSAKKLVHDFRRTACRNLVQKAGVSGMVAMEMVGWGAHSMLMRYGIVDGASIGAAAERYGAVALLPRPDGQPTRSPQSGQGEEKAS